MKHFIRVALLCAIAGAGLFFYQQTHTNKTAPLGKTIRLGISADNPPFTFLRNGKFVGFELDLAQAIASELKYNLEVLDLDFSGLIAAVKNGVIDVAISGLEITEERKKNIAFSNPYYATNIATIGHRAYSAPSEFPAARIGVQHGSTFDTIAKKLQTQFPDMTILGFHRINQAVQELEQKTIDIIIIDTAVAAQITASHPALIASKITIEDASNGLGAIFKKGSPLISKFNLAIDKLKAAGSINDLEKKWLNSAESASSEHKE